MRILVLAGDVPATTSMPGSPRLFSLCKELSRSHELHLVTGCSSLDRHQSFLGDATASGVYKRVEILPAPYPAAPAWWNRQRHRLKVETCTVTKYLYPEYHHQVCEMIRNVIGMESIDLVYVDGLTMTQYADTGLGRPAIVDLHDSLTLLVSRMIKMERSLKRKLLLYPELFSIARWERSLHRTFPLIITNSKRDEMRIRELSPEANTLTIGNGVDSVFFSPRSGLRLPQRLVFTGVMNYGPNEDAAVYFCDQIFPMIRSRIPEAEFWVVGKDPTPSVRALAERAGVHVTGCVPDMRPYLESAGIFVCPLRYGAGIKN